MPIQSEAALETGLIATLQQMDYEYVQIAEEKNLLTNFKRQLEIHNRKKLAEFGRSEFTADEFDKILIYLEGGTRFEKAKKLRDLYPLDTADGKRIWVEFLDCQQWCQVQAALCEAVDDGGLCVNLGEPHSSLLRGRRFTP